MASLQFAIADPLGRPVTAHHPTAIEAWKEFIPDLPDDPDAARSEQLAWVGRGYRVVDRLAQGT